MTASRHRAGAYGSSGIINVNSTATPLGGGGVFTGAWFDAEGFSNLTVMVFTSHDSAVGGLVIEHSSDGSNVDAQDTFTVPASPEAPEKGRFSVPLPGRWFRVKYTNGATPQTAFRLQAKVHVHRQKPSSHRLADTLSSQEDAELTKSVLMARLGGGDFGHPALGPGLSVDALRTVLADDQVALVSTLNSTTTPLAGGATFNSAANAGWEDVRAFSGFTITAFSDVSSAADGMLFQWTDDPTGTRLRTETSALTGGTMRAFNLAHRGRYFRVKYTNGATPQATFALQVVHRMTLPAFITKPLKGAVTEENFAQLVQAALMSKLADGSFLNTSGISLGATCLLGTSEADAIIAELGGLFTVATAGFSAGTTAETPVLLIRNPLGSGKVMRLNKTIFGIPSTDYALWTCYMNPTVTTVGTSLTPVGNRQTGQSSPVGLFTTLPTVSALGTRFFSVRTVDSGVPFLYDQEFSRLLEANNSILVTITQGTNNSTSHLSLEYAETPI